VIGSCFLTSSWQVKTTAQFVGTCIGVFLIVVLTEAVRRWGREWDRYIVRQAMQRKTQYRRGMNNKRSKVLKDRATGTRDEEEGKTSQFGSEVEINRLSKDQESIAAATTAPRGAATLARIETAFFGLPRGSPGAIALASYAGSNYNNFRPTAFQQAVRSLVYGIQFTGAVSSKMEESKEPALSIETDRVLCLTVYCHADSHELQWLHSHCHCTRWCCRSLCQHVGYLIDAIRAGRRRRYSADGAGWI
jgi:hypothetical protein